MLFSSNVFLFIFLPIVLTLYFINKNRVYRNTILCISSLIFYAWGEPKYIFLIILSIVFNYFMVILFDSKKKYKKQLFIFTIIVNIAILGYFKYFNFLITALNQVFNAEFNIVEIILPIGISFYTFQMLSYVIDSYKGKVKVQRNIVNLATYIVLFPQLIAGPIVRYETIEDELTNRKESLDDITEGLKRFIFGLGKKVIIANHMAYIADFIFGLSTDQLGTSMIWIGAITYTFQIYFDFSGYSDMAIGLGKVFGFNFFENFNYPYISKSITEFWRRWHISLSSWFKDYVYIPLGGNKVNKFKWIRNIFIVWGLTGLWHGANYNFILWGLYYGIILLLEKTVLSKLLEKTPNILKHFYTILLFIIGWVIFRVENIDTIFILVKNMFIYQPSDLMLLYNNYDFIVSIPYIIFAAALSMPYLNNLFNKFISKNYICETIGYIYCLGILFLSLALLLSNTYNPFIYFRF